jgi:hypothetical protein
MSTAIASLQRHRHVILFDVLLLTALYLLPGLSHVTAFPLYMFEPMRVALILALLFTNRSNTYLLAFTIPLASSMITGHPVFFKAVLMGIELSILVATYSYLVQWKRIPAFVALTVGILSGKLIYYSMKYVALSTGMLSGSLISTPIQTQIMLAVATAAVFGLLEHLRTKNTTQEK